MKNVEDRRGAPRRLPWWGALLAGLIGITAAWRVVAAVTAPPPDDGIEEAGAVLADLQWFWGQELGPRYQPVTLVVYREGTESVCGYGAAVVGPFYCPADRRVYLDLGFWTRLAELGATGRAARGYVIAHEVGHHVQRLLGDTSPPGQLRELQADCLAGRWIRSASSRGLYDRAELGLAVGAAAAVGDDVVGTAGVDPGSWTHGVASMRADAVRAGLIGECASL